MAAPVGSVVTVDRDDFLTDMWPGSYRPGDHVTILGPTDSGKTYLSYQLLDRICRPSLPAVVMCMKPRDNTVRQWTETLGLRLVRSWPPPPNPFHANPRGWTVWPKHTFDIERDDDMMAEVFRATIRDSYKRGNRILFADEVVGLAEELHLAKLLQGVWMRGRSMGTGLWAASQRPAYVPLHAYSQAAHLFLAYDPDLNSRKRFSEIGGIDPRVVLETTANLPERHFMYIRRRGQRRCVITP